MKTHVFKQIGVTGLSIAAFALLAGNPANADRGGWADPEGGWSFVEEWVRYSIIRR